MMKTIRNQATEPVQPLACNLDAMSEVQRERYRALGRQIWPAIQETVELSDGYAFRLPAETDLCLIVAEFMTLERLCCPFFRLVLEIEPNGGPMWLRVTGEEGVKEFLREELQVTTRTDACSD